MILGLSVAAFTKLHVAISLVAILSGLVTVLAMIGSRNLRVGAAVFLATTVLTSLTGFFFHAPGFGPPQVVGVISLVAVAAAIWARYVRRMAGVWRQQRYKAGLVHGLEAKLIAVLVAGDCAGAFREIVAFVVMRVD